MSISHIFSSLSLRRRFTILAGAGLIVLSTGALAAITWLQNEQTIHSLQQFSSSQLDSLHAFIVTAMNKRPDDSNDIGVKIYNEWFQQRNKSQGDQLWSVWSDQVREYMASSSPETTPKVAHDDIDREALGSGQTVARIVGNSYRMSKPIILGVSDGANLDTCHACHGAMGLKDGDVIAVLSSSVDIAAEHSRATRILLIVLVVGVLMTLSGVLGLRHMLDRLVTGPVGRISDLMQKLAEGQLNVTVEGTERQDEIGALARAFAVFRENAINKAKLETLQTEEAAARSRRIQHIDDLARHFEQSVAIVLKALTDSADRLQGTAQTMLKTSAIATDSVSVSVEASTYAGASVKAVSSAADQLSTAIDSIDLELTKSTNVSREAVSSVEESVTRVRALAEAIGRIREIVSMISGIAGQTNLLALNATIEAARAGEAGKGFAVVASEVKALANQTATATEDITSRIEAITRETEQTVATVQKVRDTIGRMDQALVAITSAVEEQDAATREIAASSQRAAEKTEFVANNIHNVSDNIGAVDREGHALDDIITDLGRQSADLRREVSQFLEEIRKA